jgi:BAR domain
VDYDGQRHTFQALQTSKKREEVKITRAKEQLEEAKRTFALFNAELNEELPALYESRVLFSITNLQTLFSAEQVFHSELSKVTASTRRINEPFFNLCFFLANDRCIANLSRLLRSWPRRAAKERLPTIDAALRRSK